MKTTAKSVANADPMIAFMMCTIVPWFCGSVQQNSRYCLLFRRSSTPIGRYPFVHRGVSCRRIFAGDPSTSEPGGIFVPDRDQRVCANDRARADFHIVENDGAHADQYFIVDFACVNDRGVADRDQFAHACWVTGVHVDDSVVLNVRARPDDDAVDITAKHRAVPDA